MSKRPPICAAAVGALVIGQAAAMAGPAPPPGFDAVAPASKPTAVSGLEVVAKRATKVSGVDVAAPVCPQPKKSDRPEAEGPDAGGPRGGDAIVAGKGRLKESPPPKIVSSFPAKGDVIRPGLLVLRMTFDQPMTCMGLLRDRFPFPDPCPPPLREPMISKDRRTFLTVCTIEANRHYGLWLRNFASVRGQASPPFELEFDSSGQAGVASVDEAMAEDAWLRKTVTPGS